jgi:hypothetical protein
MAVRTWPSVTLLQMQTYIGEPPPDSLVNNICNDNSSYYQKCQVRLQRLHGSASRGAAAGVSRAGDGETMATEQPGYQLCRL